MSIQEFAIKHKVPLMVGGAAVVGYMFLRGRGGSEVAIAPPVNAGPMPTAAPSGAQPEIDAGQRQAMELQNQMAQEAIREQKLGFDLGLASQRKQELYEGRQQQMYLEQQQHTMQQQDAYARSQQALVDEQLHYEKAQHKGIKGFLNNVLGFAERGAKVYGTYSSLPGLPLPSGQYTSVPGSVGQGNAPYYGPYAPGYTPPAQRR